MKTFAKQKIAAASQPPFIFKFTIAGWILLLFAIGLLGYLVYDGIQAPARTKKYEQRIAEQTKINVGDIYLGRMTMYREKGVLIGSKKEFGWFKIVKKENDTYHLVKSIEMINAPKNNGESLNSTDFEKESIVVKAIELEPYHKALASEDGLIEIALSEKKP
ncbi:hypothetical protein [Empedobacter brevis]|uniref:hypothetical protein n=1 Tax=Empedobacter brevis TaxID=247 RepID=UPI00289C397D|nr:hypothetical protein [Empedobacter brevis]